MADMLNSEREHDQSDAASMDLSVEPVPSRTEPSRRIARPINLIPTIQGKVIPRLHAALHKSLGTPRVPLAIGGYDDRSEISNFADRLLADDLIGANARIDALRIGGQSLETIYLNLLAPAACHLRDLWSEDFCGLADVTLALCSLQGILRHYALDFYAEVARRENGMRALLVSPGTGSTNVALPTFGLLLMSEFFRREGWDAWVERDLSSGSFRGAVVGEWFDMVEVLATSDKQLDEISSGIKAIRRGSPNPSIGVIVCGQVFIEHPEFVRLVGADVMATDPLSSLAQAKTLAQAKSHVTRSTQRERLS